MVNYDNIIKRDGIDRSTNPDWLKRGDGSWMYIGDDRWMEHPDMRHDFERGLRILDVRMKPLADAIEASQRLGNDLDLIVY